MNISVAILSYNSSATILDTLESIKCQSYRNIDLIISDDSSTDNTLEVIKSWVDVNKDRFNTIKVLDSKVNTGVSGNANRALNTCRTEYIKYIAADDILVKNALEEFSNFIKVNGAKDIVVGKIFEFTSNSLVYDSVSRELNIKFSVYKHEKDLIGMINQTNIRKKIQHITNIAPSTFLKVDYLRKMGGFDEKYKMLEDLPLFLKSILNNNKFELLDKYVVYYRHSDLGLCSSNTNERYCNVKFYNAYKQFYFEVFRKAYLKEKMFYSMLCKDVEMIRTFLIVKFGGNKKGIIYKITKVLTLVNYKTWNVIFENIFK